MLARDKMTATRSAVARLLREPLLHFVLLGGLVFALQAGDGSGGAVDEEGRIVITGAEVARLAESWSKKWQRPPTKAELDGLVREAVREQVLYREARALGLDRDDVVIRRHLRQKYEFVTQDLAYDADPDDTVLRAWHAAQPDRYAAPAQLSFRHILFSPDRRGAAVAEDAARVLADLRGEQGLQATDHLGDATSLPGTLDGLSEPQIAAMFGPEFAAAIVDLEAGQWAGPIPSGYGLHLVWVSQNVAGGPRPFEEVQQRVRDDWVYDQRVAANEAIFQQLLQRYDIVVEPPAALPLTSGGGS